jgi:hypothetical protein
LIFARLRVWDIFVRQDFGATELMNADGFHGTSFNQTTLTQIGARPGGSVVCEILPFA